MRKKLTAAESTEIVSEITSVSKVIPVLTVTELDDAIPLAEALMDGGLTVVEVTLRTHNAFEIIREMTKVKNIKIGVGTLLNRNDVENAIQVGASFGVSPGLTEDLVLACEENGLPLLGGVSSVSDMMKMFDQGYKIFKFFPAEVSGGVPLLKALQAPLPQISFCPTGGLSLGNAREYLALRNVICIGGSWMATPEMIENKEWDVIANQAHLCANLG